MAMGDPCCPHCGADALLEEKLALVTAERDEAQTLLAEVSQAAVLLYLHLAWIQVDEIQENIVTAQHRIEEAQEQSRRARGPLMDARTELMEALRALGVEDDDE